MKPTDPALGVDHIDSSRAVSSRGQPIGSSEINTTLRTSFAVVQILFKYSIVTPQTTILSQPWCSRLPPKNTHGSWAWRAPSQRTASNTQPQAVETTSRS